MANKDLAIEKIVLRQDTDGITTITLNRPKQFNALSAAMIAELQTIFEKIEHDPTVRVVVIAGVGPGFCAGHDLKEMMANRNENLSRIYFNPVHT